MILGGQHEIGIEIIGTNCTVPDSHMACLMYYLRSVNSSRSSTPKKHSRSCIIC